MNACVKVVNVNSISHDEWLKYRKDGIGGSDIGAIVGMNPYRGAFDVFVDKTTDESPDISDRDPVYWGTVLEPIVAKEFEKRSGKKVRRCNFILRSAESPFAFADVDRLVDGEDAGLECKTTNAFNCKEWENDEVPASYVLQCQWYMYVTGYSKWYIACLIGGQRFVWSEIKRDDDLIKMLVSRAREFWDNVQNGIPPDIDGSDSCTEYLNSRYSSDNAETVIFTSDIAGAAAELCEVKKQEKALKEYKAALENKIKQYMGEAQAGECERYSVSWKTQRGTPRFDRESLIEDYGITDISDYYTETKIRKFTIKEKSDNGK